MFIAAKIRIRKLTAGEAPADHVAAIVAAAVSIARKQTSFEGRLVELRSAPEERSGDWVALGHATVHPAGPSRYRVPKPAMPAVGRTRRIHGATSEAAD